MADPVLSAMRRILYGDRREGGRTTYRAERARETALRYRPWERGKIGNVEKRISRAFDDPRKLLTTGELVRLIYANVAYDQNFHPRPVGAPLPELKSWMFSRVRRAAPTFCDRGGRSRGRGRPWLWRIRSDQYSWEVRRAKEAAQRQIKRRPSKSGHRQSNP
jgi:hypothetical protein